MPLTIVVTGASRGLGAGMAQYFAEQGHRLGLCARTTPSLVDDELQQQRKDAADVLSMSVDVTDPQAVQDFASRVVDRFGRIDLWINNAGILGPIKPIRDTELEDFRTNVDINLIGVFNGTKTYIQHLRSHPPSSTGEGGGGSSSSSKVGTLVNISSGAAVKGYSGWGAYCSSKAGVDRLTECALLEEGEKLRAYSIAPGVIDTGMQSAIRASSTNDFPMRSKFVEIKANNQFNTPPFVAQKILDLVLFDGPQTLPVVQRLPPEK